MRQSLNTALWKSLGTLLDRRIITRIKHVPGRRLLHSGPPARVSVQGQQHNVLLTLTMTTRRQEHSMPRTNNHGQNGDTLDGVTSRRRRERPSQRQRQQPQPTTTLLPNFNNSRTLWILSLLLLITLLVQIQLIAHHEEFILQMDEFEEEFSGILSAANAMAYDATNTAYDFRQHLFFTANDHVNQTKLIAIYSNYSMDPIDILSRAGVDHSAGYVPSISVREALASTRKRRRNHPHKKRCRIAVRRGDSITLR